MPPSSADRQGPQFHFGPSRRSAAGRGNIWTPRENEKSFAMTYRHINRNSRPFCSYCFRPPPTPHFPPSPLPPPIVFPPLTPSSLLWPVFASYWFRLGEICFHASAPLFLFMDSCLDCGWVGGNMWHDWFVELSSCTSRAGSSFLWLSIFCSDNFGVWLLSCSALISFWFWFAAFSHKRHTFFAVLPLLWVACRQAVHVSRFNTSRKEAPSRFSHWWLIDSLSVCLSVCLSF